MFVAENDTDDDEVVLDPPKPYQGKHVFRNKRTRMSRKYNWGVLFDGNQYLLKRGQHFHVDPKGMLYQIRTAMRKRDLKGFVEVEPNGDIFLEVTGRMTPEEIKDHHARVLKRRAEREAIKSLTKQERARLRSIIASGGA